MWIPHYHTFWVLQFIFVIDYRCKGHMQLMTYELLNPRHFIHLVAKDHDETFSCEAQLYYN